MLFGRQRDAEHVGLEALGEIEPEPAPARADVEHVVAGLDAQLGGDVALLGELRLLERHVRSLEIGAGILHVRVEEEPVKFAGQIVVVLHVAPGARRRVDLIQAAEGVAQAFERLRPGRFDSAGRSQILVDQLEQASRRLRRNRARRPCRLRARPASDRR